MFLNDPPLLQPCEEIIGMPALKISSLRNNARRLCTHRKKRKVDLGFCGRETERGKRGINDESVSPTIVVTK